MYDNENLARILEKNIGYGYGIHQGLKACDADVIGWSHADLECNPADVFVAYNMFKNAPNTKILVKGHRYGRNWKSLILTHALTVFSAIFLLTIFDDINGQPKVFHKDLFNKFKRPPNGFSYDLYVQYKAKKNKYNVLTFNIFFGERKFGFSKWAGSFFKRLSTIKDWAKDVFKIMLGIFK